MKPLRWMAALVAAMMMLAVACGGDDGDDATSDTATTTVASTTTSTAPATTTTSTTVAPTTTTVSPEEEVLAAYRKAWEQQRLAMDPPDPAHPGLLASHADPALTRILADLAARQRSGLAYRGSVSLDPQIESMGDGTAVVIDCVHEVGVDVELATGRNLNPVDESIQRWNTMILEDGEWKRSDQRSGGPCIP